MIRPHPIGVVQHPRRRSRAVYWTAQGRALRMASVNGRRVPSRHAIDPLTLPLLERPSVVTRCADRSGLTLGETRGRLRLWTLGYRDIVPPWRRATGGET